MSTKKLISEQVALRLYGRFPISTDPTQEEDIWAALEQKINAKFKMEQFNVTMPSGDTLPNNLCLSYYEGATAVTVTSNGNGTSKCTLPIMPIALPRNMGVYEITDANNVVSFIPIFAGQRMLLKSQPLINDLLGQVGFETRGRRIDFTKDLPLLGLTSVNMALVVMDVSSYSITDMLPLPSDMTEGIVNELVAQFSPTPPDNGLVNNYSNANTKQLTK